jgi:hypothetical protein
MNQYKKQQLHTNKALMLIVFLITFSTNLPSQTKEIGIHSGDSLILNLGGYTAGDIQWQRYSTISSGWLNISGASAQTGVLRYKPLQPVWLRAQVTETDCAPYYTDTLQVNLTRLWTRADARLEGGHGYIWPFVSSNAGLSMEEKGSLTSWTNKDRKARWYLYQPAGKYDFGLIMAMSPVGSKRDFKITCTPAYEGLELEPVEREFSYTGRGSSKLDTVLALSVNIPKDGYFLYELESKNTTGNITISSLALTGHTTPTAGIVGTPHLTDYLSSPSVHLHYTSTQAPNTNSYDWIYQEVLVPPVEEGFSHTATYWESIGFRGGYLGLQNNTDEWRRILFSVWDQIDTDVYNKAERPLPVDSLVSLVDKGDSIQANGFGGEGTGGQSYRQHAQTWREGIPVKFLFNVRRDEAECTTCPSGKKPTVILSAWYCAYELDAPDLDDVPAELKGWKYVASWRRPFHDVYQNGTGSFIENFSWANGHLPRKGYYYNTYNRHQQTGHWYHFNESWGSHTDGQTGQRPDIEFGVSPDPGHTNQFYMLSGGYGSTKKTPGTFRVPYVPIEDFPYLNDLDLQPFVDRVNLAMEREKAEQDLLKSKKDKTGWTMAYYSSQEPNDNGGPRLANMIIDNDANTFWHSKWTGTSSQFPHILIIDMQTVQPVSALYIVQNGGANYHLKGLQVGLSDTFEGAVTGVNPFATTDAHWTPIWSGNLPNAVANTIRFDGTYTGRYLRLYITSDWGLPPHVRINEVDVFGK